MTDGNKKLPPTMTTAELDDLMGFKTINERYSWLARYGVDRPDDSYPIVIRVRPGTYDRKSVMAAREHCILQNTPALRHKAAVSKAIANFTRPKRHSKER